MDDLKGLYRGSAEQLQKRLIPFWEGLMDKERGGFYGQVADDLSVKKDAVRGGILNSRILWFFSSAYLIAHEEGALPAARHAYEYLKSAFLDPEYGGVYWSVTADGKPADDSKHCYAQAFALYGLAAYAHAERSCHLLSIRDGNTDDSAAEEALAIAYRIYDLIESKMRDEGGYGEAYDRQLHPVSNEKLSENGVEAARTMNTLLHVLEAYTELYLTDEREDVYESICKILDLFLDRIYDRSRSRLGVFFDADYHSLIDLYSYGHDIEASWLIDRALDAVGDYPRETEVRGMTQSIVQAIYEEACREKKGMVSLPMEAENGVVNESRVWWVQAEALNGFLNGAQQALKTGDMTMALKYTRVVDEIWTFINTYLVDGRKGGEWFYEVNEEGKPNHDRNIADEWKCPYHNGRMLLEIIRRLNREGGSAEEYHVGTGEVCDRYLVEAEKQEKLLSLKNEPLDEYNGILTRYRNPVLTREHVPLIWRYDVNPRTNPLFLERLGINAVMNSGAIYHDGKYCLVARIEGNDRKSFFGVAESDNGIDGFRFRDYPCEIGEAPGGYGRETNVYDMRLTKHEDGWIYGVFCSEAKDTTTNDLSAAVAAAGIVRTRDLVRWERLPNLVTKRSPQQRNVVLHPEFVDGQYAFYTRPMDDFIDTGSGSGIGFGLCRDITKAVIDEEKMTSLRKYHQITEAKNGEGAVPIKTDRGWIHIAHGVRNTAAGLRYVLYAFATDLKDPSKVIAEPGGLLLGPRGWERVGDVSNVVFSNGCIVRENGDVYLYYAGSDTRMYVATTTMERLIDYVFNTPPDAERSALCVQQRIDLIKKNEKYLKRR